MLDSPEFILLIMVLFIIGCFVGSFIGVIIERMARSEQFVSGRSYCEHCKTQLQWIDMVPVLSYIFMQGKCRYCKHNLSYFLPTIEIVSGFILLTSFYVSFFSLSDQLIFNYDSVFKFLYIVSIAYLLAIIFFMDTMYMLIPMVPFYIFCLIFLLYSLFFTGTLYLDLEYKLYGFFAMFLFFFGMHFFTKGKMMGEGDIFLASAFGFILGLDGSILMWILSFLFGSFYALYLMSFKGAGLKQSVPFGPFLILSYLVCSVYADEILSIYFKLLI